MTVAQIYELNVCDNINVENLRSMKQVHQRGRLMRARRGEKTSLRGGDPKQEGEF
jgi:hypothetical protein